MHQSNGRLNVLEILFLMIKILKNVPKFLPVLTSMAMIIFLLKESAELSSVTSKNFSILYLSGSVIDIAKKYSPEFRWHDDAAEHSLEYTYVFRATPGLILLFYLCSISYLFAFGRDGENVKHSLYFPSVYSIARRVAMMQELGVGLSIWEIGQGFDSFFEQI